MGTESNPPRPSATIVLLREGEQRRVEVLMLQRADRGDQNSLRWVFPGGLLDASDDSLRMLFHDLDDAAASARIATGTGGLDYWAAALRETLEEAGLLLAVDLGGQPVDVEAHEDALRDWCVRARGLPRGTGGAAYAALCADRGWRLPGRSVHPIAHWITPLGLPKRYDTIFFVAAAPAGQEVRIDGAEIIDHRWVPLEHLAARRAELSVRGPTLAVAQELARFASVDAALEWARSLGPLDTIRPRLAHDAGGQLSPVHPLHPSYAEIGRIDPLGRGLAHSRIRAGAPVMLVEQRVIRLTADNGGMMTGPGTNTYLLRAAERDWVLIDPGPDDAAHVRATLELLHQVSGRLAAILVTHTHIDHSPAARALSAATGAPCMGRLADHRERQDPYFLPDVTLEDGERLDFGGGCVVRVIHTPGHASNHLCYLHEAQRMLFTGDHVMQGSTVVINPPDGDMAAYLAALERLVPEAARSFDVIAPGHGFLMAEPVRVLSRLIAHRQQREATVRRVLTELDGASIEELVVRVYSDVGPERHAVASRSLLAHLLHLRQQGVAAECDGRWAPLA
jgi:glyoxylase-like metal-dependent hydrolase (beta-lactamase superfamily II)/8-oxo-dGTP pyrophosphatase MutT (NUDIX family)